MTTHIRNFRRTLLGIALCSGLGIATLPGAAQANYCMKSKPYAYKGGMMPYGAQPYPPMMRHHHYHGHKGMYGKHDKYSMRPGSGKTRSYGDAYATESAAAAGVGEDDAASPGASASGMDIIETAASAQDFSTLIRAARAADLYDVLRGDGPFTVFAPSDAAFASLPEGTLDALLADRDKLVAVLTYHVVPERLTAADLLQRREFTTVQGQKLTIDKLNVATADIDASNGIIHVIDAVLIPEQ